MEAAAYRQFRTLEESHWWFRGRRAVYLGLLRHQLGAERPARILDLGCGVGGFLGGLAAIGECVFPTDMDKDSLVTCRERGFANGVVSDGYALPYRDGAFDLVCLFDTVEHIPDDQRAMREVTRVLAPGGRVVVSVPAYPLLFANNDRVARHFRRYTRSTLRRLLAGADLVVERNTHANVFLFPLILPTVLLIKAGEKVFRRRPDPERTNLSVPMPRLLNRLLAFVFAAELPGSKRFDWPTGHSILAIARKREHPARPPA